jgi:hypothetical protein
MIRKVHNGATVVLSGTTFNAIAGVVNAYQGGNVPPTSPRRVLGDPGGIIRVRNASGADVDRFGVLGLDEPVYDPADHEDAFTSAVVFDGVTPETGTHDGRFAILQEPAAAGQLAAAMVAGVCIVKVNMLSANHRRADIEDESASRLASGDDGIAEILWSESGTGEKWAIVRFPSQPAGVLPVIVAKDGGSAGSSAAQCTYTYTVKDLAGNTLKKNAAGDNATGMTPAIPRAYHTEYWYAGETRSDVGDTTSTAGLAYYSLDGTLVLLIACGETLKDTTCSSS